MDSYIREYANIVPADLCRLVIDTFNEHPALPGVVIGGVVPEIRDTVFVEVGLEAQDNPLWKEIDDSLFECVQKVWHQYAKDVPETLHLCPSMEDSGYEIHRYTANQGHYASHIDCSDLSVSKRVVSVLLYLNDVEVGGETVFDNLDRNITPREGHAVLFPANFTYLHHARPPVSNDKYVIPTWLQFK